MPHLANTSVNANVARHQDRLYHNLSTPQEILTIRQEIRRFADEHVAPVAYAIGHTEEPVAAFPRDLFAKMAKSGLFGIPFTADVGGRGLKYPTTATAVMIEELAYHSNSVAAIVDVRCILKGNALNHGSDSIRQRYLRPLLSGNKVESFATTEPDASTDLSVEAMGTHATRTKDGYIVNGRKRFISSAPVADFVVLLCVDGARMTDLVVELNWPGVRVGEPDKKMGNHGQLTADIYFDNVKLPMTNLVGQPGEGLKIALQTLTFGRIGIAASGTGMAQALFDHSIARLKKRQRLAKPSRSSNTGSSRWPSAPLKSRTPVTFISRRHCA